MRNCRFCEKVRNLFMVKSRGKLEFQRKVLEQRAKIAKLAEGVKTSRVKIITAKAELKALRGRRSS